MFHLNRSFLLDEKKLTTIFRIPFERFLSWFSLLVIVDKRRLYSTFSTFFLKELKVTET